MEDAEDSSDVSIGTSIGLRHAKKWLRAYADSNGSDSLQSDHGRHCLLT